jgi:PEP-CTERM motif
MRIASLVILCLALVAIPAWADYDNGPINGTTDAWTINFGYVVSDTFTLGAAATVTSVSFGVWEFPGDTMSTVDWTITATENGTGVGLTSNVTDKFISTNQYGYNIDLITFNAGVPLAAGTYWLNLYNATVPSGDPVYWDENSGAGCKSGGCPSQASESAVGTIPSEAFTIGTSGSTGSTPEPSSIMLLGSGMLGLAGLLRRKLF